MQTTVCLRFRRALAPDAEQSLIFWDERAQRAAKAAGQSRLKEITQQERSLDAILIVDENGKILNYNLILQEKYSKELKNTICMTK